MSGFIHWPKIHDLAFVRANWLARWQSTGFPPPTVVYRALLKTHGENGGVRIEPNGGIFAQSRDGDAPPTHTLSQWVAKREDLFRALQQRKDVPTVIWGEWIYPGVKKGFALNRNPNPCFVVFAIQEGSEITCDRSRIPVTSDLQVAPDLGTCPVDFGDPDSCEALATWAGQLVSQVEQQCPLALQFGLQGPGEGVVLYPEGVSDRETLKRYLFKAKSGKHRTKGGPGSKPPIDVLVLQSAQAFADTFVTEARCVQGLDNSQDLGTFLQWVGRDVKEESTLELAASNLVWKDVGRFVQGVAKQWYLQRYPVIPHGLQESLGALDINATRPWTPEEIQTLASSLVAATDQDPKPTPL